MHADRRRRKASEKFQYWPSQDRRAEQDTKFQTRQQQTSLGRKPDIALADNLVNIFLARKVIEAGIHKAFFVISWSPVMSSAIRPCPLEASLGDFFHHSPPLPHAGSFVYHVNAT
jgi:hypothetical protein